MKGQSSVLVILAIVFITFLFLALIQYYELTDEYVTGEYYHMQQVYYERTQQKIASSVLIIPDGSSTQLEINITNIGVASVVIVGILVIELINNKQNVIVYPINDITILPQQYKIVNIVVNGNSQDIVSYAIVTSIGNEFPFVI